MSFCAFKHHIQTYFHNLRRMEKGERNSILSHLSYWTAKLKAYNILSPIPKLVQTPSRFLQKLPPMFCNEMLWQGQSTNFLKIPAVLLLCYSFSFCIFKCDTPSYWPKETFVEVLQLCSSISCFTWDNQLFCDFSSICILMCSSTWLENRDPKSLEDSMLPVKILYLTTIIKKRFKYYILNQSVNIPSSSLHPPSMSIKHLYSSDIIIPANLVFYSLHIIV